tara:strand:+ start:187 stop:876 length:690 start_codon:yes stop_codon:yes gene_type:complete
MEASTKCKKISKILEKSYKGDESILEIGVDEAGRGPMFGRVYSAAVILPNNETFKYEWMKDSKKFTSKKKIMEVANYIKENALSWSVSYESEEVIDNINIRNATHNAMHNAIKKIVSKNPKLSYFLLIDGNDFKPYVEFTENEGFKAITHRCVEGGDNKFASIAAASILAKVSRDEYIEELCENDNTLIDRYDLLKNKGYGTKKHMDGIKQYGITQYHRKTFGICREYA